MKKEFRRGTKKLFTKFMASTLIVTLSFGNFLFCGNYMVSYAANGSNDLDKQTDATLSKNVKFDSYFEINGTKTHYKTADLNNDTVELIISTHVQKEGYLKNATIDLKDENGGNDINYTVTNIQDENAIVQSASENQLVLRQINAGDKIEFKASLAAGVNSVSNVEKLNSNNKLILKGLYVDGKGEETPIEKEIEINLGWSGKYEALINQSLIKYIPLSQENENKALISMQIETGLQEKKFMLPISETSIEITVPVINGVRPTSVTVNAISTEATNGLTSENLEFTDENYEYIESEAKLRINVKNNKNTIGKNKDIYIVNYIYPQKAYEVLNKGNVSIDSIANVTIKTYSNSTVEECKAEIKEQIQINETIGKLISLSGENITETIAKGKLYANLNNPQSNDNTEYEFKWNINVGYNQGLAGIILKDKQESFESSKNIKGDLTEKTIYKQIIVNAKSFDELFGEEGKLFIYDSKDKLLALVAKDTKTDENGNYIVELLEEVSQIKIETSKPQKNGNLVITAKKEIKSDLGFTKSQIDNFETLNIVSEIMQIDEKTNEQITVEEKQIQVPLEATVTKSQISINKDKLSTLVKNENVEFTIELGNDNETSDLYVDPIFEIELPNAIENVEILESKILFDDELIIDKVEFIKKDGVPVLRIMLNGVQTKFSSGIVTNGTNIILNTNIVVNNLTPTKTEEIRMYYYNSNTVNYDNGVVTDKGLGGLATTNIEFVAPTGMITINGISNYDGNDNLLMSVNQGDLIEQVETYKPARIAKMHLLAINNTGNTCTSLVVLGRIPFAGNKDLETGEDLGTTIDTYLRGYITSESLQGDGLKIYYSENGEATSAIADENNAWTLTPTDLSKVKSYMIVIEGYEFKQGEAISFTYDFEIPQNIGYNHTICSNYGIYYVNNTQVASVSSFAKSDKVGITTGKGPEINITQSIEGADENGIIDVNNVLKFVVSVSNTGTEAAKNVKIENEIPKWTNLVRVLSETNNNYEIYPDNADSATMKEWNVVKNKTEESGSSPTVGWEIENLAPGETVTKEVYIIPQYKPDIYTYYKDYPGFTIDENGKYYISTNKYDAETDSSYEEKNEITSVPEMDIQNVVLVSANNINAVLKSTSDTVEVRESNVLVREVIDLETDNRVQENKEVNFTIGLVNGGENTINNLVVKKTLPQELQYVSSSIQVNDEEGNVIESQLNAKYNEQTREVSVEIPSLNQENISINVKVRTNKLESGIYEKEIESSSEVILNSETIAKTDSVKFIIVKPHYEVIQECTNTSATLIEGDEIEYRLKITNVGPIAIYGMYVEISIPEPFKIVSAVYTTQSGDVKINRNTLDKFVEILALEQNETVIFTIKAKVGKAKEDTSTIINAYTHGDGIDSNFTNSIIQKVEQSDEYKGENNGSSGGSGNNGGSTGGDISYEKKYKISGMAFLDKNENGVKDTDEENLANITVLAINSVTGSISAETTTDEDGNYLLTNLDAGKYLIIFKYDTKIYGATSYLNDSTSGIYTSSAIEKEIQIGEEKILAGVTDIIDLQSTVTNINIGLINKQKFDLKLNKSVTQITVQNNEGTKTYEFDYTKLAKVEISAKQLAKSLVIIEYTIQITNEGNIPGYAKEIVDYKVKDLTFNSSLNQDWYEGTDGNVYTKALENTIINPGETKEIKLYLNKQMTESNTAMINNVAELQETYNEQGLEDIDSIAANNAQGEDDRDTADTIVTVKTGAQAIYTLAILMILIAIVLGICLIKKTNILKSKEVYK